METPHRILEVSPSASRDEIRAAYRLLCLVWHPDRMATLPPGAREKAAAKMSDVVAAYRQLTRKTAFEPVVASPRPRTAGSTDPPTGLQPLRRGHRAVVVATLLGAVLLLLLMGLPGKRIAVEEESTEETPAARPFPGPQDPRPSPELGDDGLSLTTPRAAGFYRPPVRQGSGG